MSQSPIDDFSPQATLRYQQGWKALNRLLHEDRSFSGHERNCVFLNLTNQNGGFADISAVSGLDFAEDGRAVASTDWDFDGDLDLWITNRTAPRIRLLRNDAHGKNHFLAVKLRGDGTGTNRDAIGARVELFLAGAKDNKLIKTLHAGSGFLSQSSKWIHFGLGQSTKIERLVIDWPGGERQEYRQLKADHRYVIEQQGKIVTPWEKPLNQAKLVASEPKLPTSTAVARIVLPTRLPLPTLTVLGDQKNLNSQLSGPTLVNLWSTTCAACIEELSDWTKAKAELRAAGVDIVAINLDSPGERSLSASKLLGKIDFPHRSFDASKRLVHSLDIFQRAMLDRWQPLPVPTSFLIDRNGRVAVMYKGRLTIDQLKDDLKLLELPTEQLRDFATPFKGRWISDPPSADPLRVVVQFTDNAMMDDGVSYLQRYVQAAQDEGADRQSLGDMYYVLAVLMQEQRQGDRAIAAYRKSLDYNPDDFRAHNDLANVLAQRGQLEPAAAELALAVQIRPGDINVLRKLALIRMKQRNFAVAIDLFSKVAESRPKDVAVWYNLANAYQATGQHRQAIAHYRKTLDVAPRMMLAANNLAWLLSTLPEKELRDGDEAVRLAKAICEQTGYRQAALLDTLSVAYAEQGDFTAAIETTRKAIVLLTADDQADKLVAAQQRLELFEKRMPYRDR